MSRPPETPDLGNYDIAPANIDAEKTILGSVFLDNEAFLEASEVLLAEDFFLDSHQRIFRRMKTIMDQRRAVDIVTLGEELSINKEVEAIGGVAYLASLTEGLPRRPAIDEYIRIVKDKAMLRRMMTVCTIALTRCGDQSEPALEIATWHSGELEKIVSGGVHKGMMPVAEIIVDVMDRYSEQKENQHSTGLSFGVEDIDKATGGGMQAGEQVVIGCYSGVGKSTLLAQAVAANCEKGIPCAVFLLEPTRDDFLRRLASIVAQVRYGAATKPWTATENEYQRMMQAAMQRVAEWPLYVMDKTGLNLDELIAHGKLAMHRHEVQLIGVDYLQRVRVKAEDRNDDTRMRVGRASMGLADLVKGTTTRTMVLSQFKRAGGMTEPPTMDKLRESGQIENDAHTIVLLHLEWDDQKSSFGHLGAAYIPKQRYGIPGNCKLYKDTNTALWMSGRPPGWVSD